MICTLITLLTFRFVLLVMQILVVFVFLLAVSLTNREELDIDDPLVLWNVR